MKRMMNTRSPVVSNVPENPESIVPASQSQPPLKLNFNASDTRLVWEKNEEPALPETTVPEVLQFDFNARDAMLVWKDRQLFIKHKDGTQEWKLDIYNAPRESRLRDPIRSVPYFQDNDGSWKAPSSWMSGLSLRKENFPVITLQFADSTGEVMTVDSETRLLATKGSLMSIVDVVRHGLLVKDRLFIENKNDSAERREIDISRAVIHNRETFSDAAGISLQFKDGTGGKVFASHNMHTFLFDNNKGVIGSYSKEEITMTPVPKPAVPEISETALPVSDTASMVEATSAFVGKASSGTAYGPWNSPPYGYPQSPSLTHSTQGYPG